jgi:ubiquinone/menaquinone biosynthesis C-methylase UbiE
MDINLTTDFGSPSFMRFYGALEAVFMETYVHGYSEGEADRLEDQANTLAELLHTAVPFPAGSRVLEAGCGVGSQTVVLAARSPGAHFTSIDISRESVERTREKIMLEGLSNVTVEVADIFALPDQDESFDHVFVCFLLEHLPEPLKALLKLKRVLKTGGSITVIEGDHGSYYCYPRNKEADLAVQCLIEAQARKQGNSLIGRQLYPLLADAGFRTVRVSPRMVYVDSSKPELVEGFTKKTFIAMIEGVKREALSLNLIDEETWNRGIAGLTRATEKDGTFCYTFFKATALK